MTKSWIKFAELKDAIRLEDVLAHYGRLDKMRGKGDQLTGFCPLPGHTGKGKKSPSFSVNTAKNIWRCFSCNQGGNLLDFVLAMENLPDVRAAGLWLAEHFPGAAGEPPRTVEGAEKPVEVESAPLPEPEQPIPENLQPLIAEPDSLENKPLTFALKHLDQQHPYLQERGLTPETIATFGLGYCTKGLMKGRIAIPLHNAAGDLVAYAGRALTAADEADGKYKLPPGFRKEVEVYNLHRIAPGCETLIVVEGFFGVMWLHQCGFPNAVALMGTSLSEAQERLIANAIAPDGRIVLMLDGNAPGIAGAQKALLQLTRHVFVYWLVLPDEKQPDHCTAEELESMVGLPPTAVGVKGTKTAVSGAKRK